MGKEEQSMLSIQFIREKFREYYTKKAEKIKSPVSLEKREFGFVPFKKEKSMIRHKAFENSDKLKEFLKNLIPSDVYYSSAYYKKPAEEKMIDKGWFGADLIFDIDCDHIKTPCKDKHDTWVCANCNQTGRGEEPTRCPSCKSEKFEVDSWICEKCLETAKQETLKLILMLEEDFGILDRDMKVVFSGHRGYHIHIEDNIVKKLTADERKEIVDYVTATVLNIQLHTPESKDTADQVSTGQGWKGRIAKGAYTLLLKKPEDLSRMGFRQHAINQITANREQLLDVVHTQGIPTGKTRIHKIFTQILEKAITLEAAEVDTVVTSDIHRLIRLPDTLHGKTGFRVVQMTVEKLNDFEPLRDSVAFDTGSIMIKIGKTKSITIGDKVYGPYKNERAELPMASALFFLCRGEANLI